MPRRRWPRFSLVVPTAIALLLGALVALTSLTAPGPGVLSC